ncbi:DUF134 domain-containing protein [Ligaoa zhengdingensis]|uniref:DUF134 domain-containing protein n=1 Tax=Ligaoa zhengdingensis TaxID=2763658 RepID=UPI0031BA9467
MPRPRKWRRVCCMPQISRFGPLDGGGEAAPAVRMTVDEFEMIRLIDLEGLTQEEAARRMSVSRTTVQSSYNVARRKLADSLVNGRLLLIEGGDYVLCGEDSPGCGCGHCRRRRGGCPAPGGGMPQSKKGEDSK